MNAKSFKTVSKATLKICFLIGWWLQPVHANIIALYDFTGQSLVSADTELNATSGNFVINFANNAGTTNTAGGTVFARSTVVYGGGPSQSASGSEEGAINLGHYFAFSVTPASGYQMDLTSISFDALLQTDPANSPTPTATWFVKSSNGGFGSDDPTLGSRNANVATTDSALVTISPLIDLSALPLITDTIEFRLYVYDNQHSSGILHRLDNVILRGDVSVIPEPRSIVMVAIAIVAAGVFKRRRRQ